MVQGDIQLVQIMFDEPWDYHNDNGMKNEKDSKSKSTIDRQSDQYEWCWMYHEIMTMIMGWKIIRIDNGEGVTSN